MAHSPGAQRARSTQDMQSAHADGHTTNGQNDLFRQFGEAAADVGATVKEHPYAALAVTAGLAFTIGALWKLRQPSRQSHIQSLLGNLSDKINAKQLKTY